MTERTAADDIDESVFDAPEGETPEAAETQGQAETPDKPDPAAKIAEIAKKIGHASRDEWKGDPADYLEAPEFILKAAGEVLPSMRKSLEKANEEISGLKKAVKTSIQHISKARQDGYEQRSRELQAELAQYAAAGDVANVKSVTDDIVALEKQVRDEPADETPTEAPEFTAWREENPWFGKDRALTAAAAALGEEVIGEGYTGKAQIKEVDRRLREQFPEKFAKPENPARRAPATIEGGGTPRRGSGGKSFSDMPREHQEMCLDLMRQSKAINKDNYAREFFAGQETR